MLFSFLYICLQLIQNYASSFSHIRFIIRRKRDTHYYEMTITLPFIVILFFISVIHLPLMFTKFPLFVEVIFWGLCVIFASCKQFSCILAELCNISAS